MLEKEDVLQICKDYLKDNDGLLSFANLINKTDIQIVQNLNKITPYDFDKLLEAKPELINKDKFIKGWHILHYLISYDNIDLYKICFYHYLKNNNCLPNTQNSKVIKKQILTKNNSKNIVETFIPEQINVFHLCSFFNATKCFSYSLMKLNNPEKIDFEELLLMGLVNKKTDFCLLLSKILKEKAQEIFLKYFNDETKNFDFCYEQKTRAFIIDGLKYNFKKITDFGIDIKYKGGSWNYFTKTLIEINKNFYLYNYQNNFIIDTINYFIENKFDIYEKDGLGNIPKELIINIKNKISDDVFENKIKNILMLEEKKYLEKIIPENSEKEKRNKI